MKSLAAYALALLAFQATARKQQRAEVALYAPEQHELYDGRFVLSASKIYQVGRLGDASGWNHMGNDAAGARAVSGTIEIDVDEKANAGTFIARLQVPEGNLYIRSPETDDRNNPPRKVFDHFFAMEVTWN